jgi:hypothetical protein
MHYNWPSLVISWPELAGGIHECFLDYIHGDIQLRET